MGNNRGEITLIIAALVFITLATISIMADYHGHKQMENFNDERIIEVDARPLDAKMRRRR